MYTVQLDRADTSPRLGIDLATTKIATAKFSSYTPIHLSRSVQNRAYQEIAKLGSAELDIGHGGMCPTAIRGISIFSTYFGGGVRLSLVVTSSQESYNLDDAAPHCPVLVFYGEGLVLCHSRYC